jgi:predicted Zn-dependent protease
MMNRRSGPLMLAAIAVVLTAMSGLRPAAAIDLPGIGNLGDKLKDKVKAVGSTGKKAPAQPVEAAGKALTAVVEASAGESDQKEIELGRGVAAKMLGAFNLVDDPALQAYVGKVGMIVASRGERPELPWRFAVVDAPSINAFAMPGGVVLITRGLYELLETEDELAALVGHEIAHVQRRHHYEVMKRQKLVGIVSDAAASQLTVDNALLDKLWSRATEVMVRSLDKSAEYEADRDGMVLAARAGYDASALLTVLEKIGAGAARGTDAALLYSTHPSPAARVAALGEAVTPELEAAALPSPAAPRLRELVAQAP